MNNKGKVGFLGSCQIDFLLYCARTLARMEKKVLVVDESRQQELASLVFLHRMEKPLSIVMQSRVDITTGSLLQSEGEDSGDYDFVLYYFGDAITKDKTNGLDELFAISFCDRIYLERLRNLMISLQIPMHVILRNACGDATNRKFFFYFLEQENAFIEERFLLPFDEVDETYRIRFQYEVVGDFNNISNYMEQTVRRVLQILCPEESNEIYKAFKKAKKGEWL